VRNEQLRADPSQGSHFFQNITSLGIPYLTVDEKNNSTSIQQGDHIDWAWLQELPVAHDGAWIRHVRLDHSLTIKCEGQESTGIIMYREELIDNACSIED
jgi:hypothetical protein